MSDGRLPRKIQASLDYLSYIEERLIVSYDATNNIELQKKLIPQEEACRKAALEVLTNYFNGEMDYDDTPPLHQPEQGIEIPEMPSAKDKLRSRPLKESRGDEHV